MIGSFRNARKNLAPSSERVRGTFSVSWLPSNVAPIVLALSVGLVNPATAELTATVPTPVFTDGDVELISRNDLLRRVVETDPWLVFKLLRAVDQSRNTRASNDPESDADLTEIYEQNPDLGDLRRAAPEAVHDLFLLIKKAEEKPISGQRDKNK